MERLEGGITNFTVNTCGIIEQREIGRLSDSVFLINEWPPSSTFTHSPLCEMDLGPLNIFSSPAGTCQALSVEGAGETLRQERALPPHSGVLGGQTRSRAPAAPNAQQPTAPHITPCDVSSETPAYLQLSLAPLGAHFWQVPNGRFLASSACVVP